MLSNEHLAPLHESMPVILSPEDYARWLDTSLHDPRALESLLVPPGSRGWEAYEVGRHVNDPSHDDPECIRPLETRDWMLEAGAVGGVTPYGRGRVIGGEGIDPTSAS